MKFGRRLLLTCIGCSSVANPLSKNDFSKKRNKQIFALVFFRTEQDHNVSSTTPVVEVEKHTEKKVTIQDDGTKDLYKALLKKRLELAESCDCMPYMVASNEALMRISITKPKDLTELSNLKCKSILLFFSL